MKIKHKVCIVGCGVISANHLTALTAMDNIEIVALCDKDIRKAEIRMQEFSLSCPIYDNYEAMIDEICPDSLYILTPHYLHAEMAIYALGKDINVFLEKPICIKEDDIVKIKNAERASRGKVCVCFQTRYNPTVIEAMKIVNADGGATYGYGTLVWNRSDDYYKSGDWRGKWATEGGGLLINQAIHTIDLLCIFIGKPNFVQALCNKMRASNVIEVEDTCSAIIDFENGRRANLLATTNASGHDTTTLHIETKNHTLDIRDSYLYLDGEMIETVQAGHYVGKRCYGNGHFVIIEKFYNALDNNTDVPVSISSAESAMRVIFTAYKSNGSKLSI